MTVTADRHGKHVDSDSLPGLTERQRADIQTWMGLQAVLNEGDRYMGVEPTGNDLTVERFSIITFREGKILRIFGIADVLSMLMQVGVIAAVAKTVPRGRPGEPGDAVGAATFFASRAEAYVTGVVLAPDGGMSL